MSNHKKYNKKIDEIKDRIFNLELLIACHGLRIATLKSDPLPVNNEEEIKAAKYYVRHYSESLTERRAELKEAIANASGQLNFGAF